MALLCKSFFYGDLASARKIQLELNSLIKALFCEVNPIPIKYACSLLGFCQNELRLPLCPTEKQEEIKITLEKYGLI
jgi:4-hydroxy-tetrahydrodipicolinate synthase